MVTYPLVSLVLCVPDETHQITDANAAVPLIKTISARWHTLQKAVIRAEENGRHLRHAAENRDPGKNEEEEEEGGGGGGTVNAHP